MDDISPPNGISQRIVDLRNLPSSRPVKSRSPLGISFQVEKEPPKPAEEPAWEAEIRSNLEETTTKTQRRYFLFHPWRFLKAYLKSLKAILRFSWRLGRYRFRLSFFVGVIIAALLVPSLGKINQALEVKNQIIFSSLRALGHLKGAEAEMRNIDFQSGSKLNLDFRAAYANFHQAQESLDKFGGFFLALAQNLPGLTKLKQGKNFLELGKQISLAGGQFSQIIEPLGRFFEGDKLEGKDLGEQVKLLQENTLKLRQSIKNINRIVKKIDIASLPPELASRLSAYKDEIRVFNSLSGEMYIWSLLLERFLGVQQPRRYLFLFENNSEIRAGGGFIGSYGVLALNLGKVTKFKVEGVFNIDGQLKDNVVPPKPLQKITTAWSMHDANWFFNFPDSARKVAWFYEKLGGGTVDAVIALTPEVLENLLDIIGPVRLPQYNLVLTKDNFLNLVQYQVEVGYDKTLNQPKKILADLVPAIMKKLSGLDSERWLRIFASLQESLEKKQIIIYFADPGEEAFILDKGWGGGVLKGKGDYLAVVNSNINGYKTDRVIRETVDLNIKISSAGEVLDTVRIRKYHQGGDSPYSWYNKVNSDFLRVFVPRGSRLLEASGYTPESYKPPIDYQNPKYHFVSDSLVEKIESSWEKDPATGTRIFQEAGKTVFGNWVYVSPGESVSVSYQYRLPLRILPGETYSLIIQKQPGQKDIPLNVSLEYPKDWKINYVFPEKPYYRRRGEIGWRTFLDKDKIIAVMF